MSARNILVICPDRKVLTDLSPMLSQFLPLVPAHDITHYPDRSQTEQLVHAKQPTLCFLDMNSDQDKALAILDNLAAITPQTKIVVLLGSNNPDLILTCLRHGAAEFLTLPVAADQLQPLLARLKQAVAGTSGGKVFAVMPVKGAVGASTVCTNIVHHWKKLGAKKILLADFDLTSGTVSFILKIKSTYSFIDALSRADSLDSDLWKGLVVHEQGIDVLLAPENPVDTSHELPDPAEVIAFCKQAYDVVVIDLGEPYSYWSLYAAASADQVLLVTTNELPSLRATQRVLHHLADRNIDRNKLKLVVNRYNPDVGLNQEAIETAIGSKVTQLIPSDYEAVQRAVVEGKPVGTSNPFGKAMFNLAQGLYEKKEEPAAAGKKKGGWVSSLFGSIVGRPAAKSA